MATQRWDGWGERLDDPALPPHIAMRVAHHGSGEERLALTLNHGLTPDVVLAIIEDERDDVVEGLLLNSAVPPDLLERLIERYPMVTEVAKVQTNASIVRKMHLTVEELSGASVHRFLTDVRATPEEERHLQHLLDTGTSGTLRDLWALVRPPG